MADLAIKLQQGNNQEYLVVGSPQFPFERSYSSIFALPVEISLPAEHDETDEKTKILSTTLLSKNMAESQDVSPSHQVSFLTKVEPQASEVKPHDKQQNEHCVINIESDEAQEDKNIIKTFVAPDVEPFVAEPLVSPICKPQGRIVTLLGPERVQYWCPKIGLVVGAIFGFYTTNLVQNFSMFFNISQQTAANVMVESLQRLSPYLGVTASQMPIAMPNAQTAAFAKIDAKLAANMAFNTKTFEVLNNVGANIAKTAASEAKASIFSMRGAQAAMSFAKEAANGDVPLNFLSVANGVGTAVGAFGGYALGLKVSNWLTC